MSDDDDQKPPPAPKGKPRKARAKGERPRRPTAPLDPPSKIGERVRRASTPPPDAPRAPAAESTKPEVPRKKRAPRAQRVSQGGAVAKARVIRPTAPPEPERAQRPTTPERPTIRITPPTMPIIPGGPALEHASDTILVDDMSQAAPDATPPDDPWGDSYFGAEAAPSPGNYDAAQDNRAEPARSMGEEMLELERRLRAKLTPAFPIFHRRRLPLDALARRYRAFAMRNRSDVVDDFGRDPIALARLRPLLDFAYDRYFRVKVAGAEHLPMTGPAILVANHGGVLPWDVLLLAHAVRRSTSGRELRPLIEDALFHTPYVGPWLNRLGAVRAGPENAARLLASEQLVAVFPEGDKGLGKPIAQRYQLQRFGRGGFIRLALSQRAPIVPVAIVGADETNPTLARLPALLRAVGLPTLPITPTFPWLGPLGLFPLPVRWQVRFGPSIDVAGTYGPEAADDPLLVARLAEGVRGTIQAHLDEATEARKSMFF